MSDTPRTDVLEAVLEHSVPDRLHGVPLSNLCRQLERQHTQLLEALRPFAAIDKCEHGILIGDDSNFGHDTVCRDAINVLAARAAIAKAESE